MVKMPIPCDIITSDQGQSGSTGSSTSNGSTSSHPSKSSNLNDATKSSSNCNGRHSPVPNGNDPVTTSSSLPSQQTTNGHAAGYIDEDVDDEQQQPNKSVNLTKSANDTVLSPSSPSPSKPASNEQEFIFIHDTGFTVKIHAPGCEPFDIQVPCPVLTILVLMST